MKYSLLIPPSTISGGAVSSTFDIARNAINRMIVHIPDGHKYLAHFQVRTKGKLIVPEFGSADPWLEGNNQNIEIVFNPALILDGPPYEITLLGYNEDDTYEHAFYLEVT